MECMHKFLLSVNMVLELFYTFISLSLYDQNKYKKSKMAATSGLAISRNLCRIAKKFWNKKCPKWQDVTKKMFEKAKMAATSGLAISRNLCRIAKKFWKQKLSQMTEHVQKKNVRKIHDGGHFRFGNISESMQNSEKVFKQKMSQSTRYNQKIIRKSKMAVTSGLAMSRNLFGIAKKFSNKRCPKWQNVLKKCSRNPRWRQLPIWPYLGIYSE
jgi:hypothetical protein